jgi:hypothetical protein
MRDGFILVHSLDGDAQFSQQNQPLHPQQVSDDSGMRSRPNAMGNTRS